jgi:hypothetical protein
LLPERNEDRLMQYYVPFEQIRPALQTFRVMGLVVRVAGDPLQMVGHVQRAIQSSSARRVFALIRPYQDLIDPQLRSWLLGATLFSAFSAIALGIATIGLFGVISYVATQRTQEMGIRRARWVDGRSRDSSSATHCAGRSSALRSASRPRSRVPSSRRAVSDVAARSGDRRDPGAVLVVATLVAELAGPRATRVNR